MTLRVLTSSMIAAAMVAAASAAAAQIAARVPQRGSADQLKQLAAKATPKLADGRTDFNGTWDHLGGIEFVRPQTKADGSVCLIGCPPAAGAARGGGQGARAGGPPPAPFPPVQTDFPKYKPEFLAKVKDLSEHQVKYDTVLQCQPPGVPRIGPPSKIVQNAREVVFLYDDVNGSFFRIIPTDGRSRRKDTPASYLGDAVGRIEGDTLVVETTNFNDETWLTDNGAFHTAALKVTERFRRRGDTMEYSAIVQDPAVLAEPWSPKGQMMWITDVEIEEPARCEDRDLDHIVDGSHHDNPR